MRNARRNQKGTARRRTTGRGDYNVPPPIPPRPSAGPAAQLDRIERKLDSTLKPKPAGGLGSGLGRLAGNFLGQGDLGASAGDAIQKWLGFGDYELISNSLIPGMDKSVKSSSIPTFSKDGKRGIRLTEREFLGDVMSGPSGAFASTSYRINPADPATFPWLSNLASQFEEWEPLGLIFEYVPTSAEFNGANQALGTIVMATDYDPTDDPYASKFVMEQSDYSCSTKPSAIQRHGIECDLRERSVRTFYTAASAPSTDLRLTDLGNFQIAAVGVSSATAITLGELWVSYDIALYKKQLLGGQLGADLPMFVTNSTTSTNSDPVGSTTSSYKEYGTLGMTVTDTGTGTVFKFPKNFVIGTYDVCVVVQAGGADVVTVFDPGAITPGLGCIAVPTIPGGSSAVIPVGVGSNRAMTRVTLQITGNGSGTGAYFYLQHADIQTTGASNFSTQYRIKQMPPVPLTLIP